MIDYCLRLGLGLGLVVIAAYSVLFAIKFSACKFKDISYNYVRGPTVSPLVHSLEGRLSAL